MALQQLFTSFDGRINRQTFWIAFGLAVAVGIVGYIIALIIGIWFSYVLSLAMLYPSAAVACKRLHDMGQTGWLALLGLIPLVGFGVLIWLGVTPSKPGDNVYGPPQSAPLEMKWA